MDINIVNVCCEKEKENGYTYRRSIGKKGIRTTYNDEVQTNGPKTNLSDSITIIFNNFKQQQESKQSKTETETMSTKIYNKSISNSMRELLKCSQVYCR